MKMFRMFGRNIRDAFRSVYRNFSLSVASITCITITLIIVSLSMLASINVNNFTKIIKEDVTMVVYLDKEIPTDNLDEVELKILENSNVLTCIKKTKEEVKQDMMNSDPFFESLMSGWNADENPLRDTYQVTVKDIEKIKDTVKELEAMEFIDFVDYGEKMVESLISIFNVVEKISIVVVLALVIVTVFLIMNTIKLTIFSRKREISIMRLVGASNITIKIPFIVEGMILGLLGSIIPVLVTIYGYYAFYNYFNGELYSSLIKLIRPETFVFMVSLVLVAIGMLVGMLGSMKGVKKYLRV